MDEDLYERGLKAFRARRLDEAREVFEQVVRDHPDSTLADNALYQLGMVHCLEGRQEEGLAAFQRCLDHYGNSDAAPLAAEAKAVVEAELSQPPSAGARELFHQGQDAASARDFEAARRAFQGLLDNHPDSPYSDNACLHLSVVLSFEGDFRGARRVLQLLLERYPGSDAAAMVPTALRRLEEDERAALST